MKETEVPRSTSRHIQWSGASRFLQGYREIESKSQQVMWTFQIWLSEQTVCMEFNLFFTQFLHKHPIMIFQSTTDCLYHCAPHLRLQRHKNWLLPEATKASPCHKFFRYMIRCWCSVPSASPARCAMVRSTWCGVVEMNFLFLTHWSTTQYWKLFIIHKEVGEV